MFTKSRLIYLSHFLSSWGDRMWRFAVALFLMDLEPDSLLLPALYGLTISGSALMFGPLVGNWIDKSRRLRAAQISLLTQNSAIIVCAVILLLQKLSPNQNGPYLTLIKISVILLGAIAQLASIATSIVIQKDWIVVIAGGDAELLSQLNSVLRRIDLVTKLVAPLVCGQIMTFASVLVACGFVAGWNLISMFVEYILLRIVYQRTPALAHKVSMKRRALEPESPGKDDGVDQELVEWTAKSNNLDDNEEKLEELEQAEPRLEHSQKETTPQEPIKEQKSCLRNIFSFILVIPKGWKVYMSQPVAKAGIGLSFLYMTVLGFNSITVSYAYNQCFSEFLVSILLGASAITGILSTFVFTPLCARVGLVRTGLLSSYAQILTLIPCVISVFAAGSPFLLLHHNTSPNITTAMPGGTNFTLTSVSTLHTPIHNATAGNLNEGIFLKCMTGIKPPSSYLSLSLLMVGAILARVGLWCFDLTVTQLFQERVPENERGVVGGVQSSLNNLMDLLHFVSVVVLPSPDQYGFLILLSVAFVCTGHFLYALFSRRETGKFFLCQR